MGNHRSLRIKRFQCRLLNRIHKAPSKSPRVGETSASPVAVFLSPPWQFYYLLRSFFVAEAWLAI